MLILTLPALYITKQIKQKILSGYLSQAAREDLIHHTTPGGRRKKLFKKF
jgi:hypothetical protein